MEAAGFDVEVELEEVEIRLERLRALYEQYFLGIERIEPAVARKDVDRRIWELRRAKMRNTAKRFKLQTVIQRYNTYQQYWGRICREIENGTYKRHLAKAEKLLGQPLTIAAKRRRGMFAKGEEAAAARDEKKSAKEQAEGDLAAMLDAGGDPAADAKKAVDDALGFLQERATSGGKATTPEPAPVAAARAAPRAPAKKLGRLDLDLDLDGLSDDDAPTSQRPAPAPTARLAPKPAAAARPVGAPAGARPLGALVGTGPARPAPARPNSPSGPGAPARPAPPNPGIAARPAAPARPPPPGGARRGGPPPAPARPAPPSPAAAAARPPGPAAPGRPPPPPRAPTGGAPPAPARPPPPAARGAGGGIDDRRVQELHARLVDAKRQTNDGKGVSVDGLARTLRATEDKLRQKHGNRKIDFDVVIKDGKAVVKPTVR